MRGSPRILGSSGSPYLPRLKGGGFPRDPSVHFCPGLPPRQIEITSIYPIRGPVWDFMLGLRSESGAGPTFCLKLFLTKSRLYELSRKKIFFDTREPVGPLVDILLGSFGGGLRGASFCLDLWATGLSLIHVCPDYHSRHPVINQYLAGEFCLCV